MDDRPPSMWNSSAYLVYSYSISTIVQESPGSVASIKLLEHYAFSQELLEPTARGEPPKESFSL